MIAHWQRWRLAFPFHKSPRRIALGVSIGLCVAMLPTIGFQMGLAFVIAWVLRASRPAAILSVWATNPLTIGPVYAFTYMVGRPFWYDHPEVSYTELCHSIQGGPHGSGAAGVFAAFQNMFSLGSDLFMPMLIGGAIVGVFVGFFAYYPVKEVVTQYQNSGRKHSRNSGRNRRRANTPDCTQASSMVRRKHEHTHRRKAA